MAGSYAAGLSKYPNKGLMGLPERFDDEETVEEKITKLAELIRNSEHVVVHTGAGLSTAAGIPDFRGPTGVWTAERKKQPPPPSKSFTEIVPTISHMALKQLVRVGIVKFVVSQNIDGLHLRSGLSADRLAELHGNMFRERCRKCHQMYLRRTPCETVGMKPTGVDCAAEGSGKKSRPCRGALVDFVLDWRSKLPESDLSAAESHSRRADLNIVLGSTLQIVPAGELPFERKRSGLPGRVVICNLQATKFDDEMDLIIRAKLDRVFLGLMERLGVPIPEYSPLEDPILAMAPLDRILLHQQFAVVDEAEKLPIKDDPFFEPTEKKPEIEHRTDAGSGVIQPSQKRTKREQT